MSKAQLLKRAYLPTPTGEFVHVRRGGSGPAVLLVPDVPGSGVALERLGHDLIERGHAVVIPDLAGVGGTTIRWAGHLTDQVRVAASAIVAMGWTNAAVVGDGVGAAVAARLALERPDLVAGPIRVLSVPYSGSAPAPNEPEPLDESGSHLVRLWHEVRDTYIYSPFWRRTEGARRPCAVPPANTLHAVFVDALSSQPMYRQLADVVRREWQALRSSMGAVTLPSGPMSNHEILRRLGPLDFGRRADTASALDVRWFAHRCEPPEVAYCYVNLGHGKVHVRYSQPRDQRDALPVLLLHPNPGSAERIEDMVLQVGSDRRAIAPDLPGHGRSDPLPESARGDATLKSYAPMLLRVMDRLGVDRFDVYGTHTGAGLAVEVAIVASERVRRVVLDGVPLFDDRPSLVADVMREYFLDLTPDTHGGHLVRAWGMLQDMALWWPWFRGNPASHRAGEPTPVETLNRRVRDFLRSAPTYNVAYRAAWSWQGSQSLPQVTQRTFVGTPPDDTLKDMTSKALKLLRHGHEATFSAEHATRGRELLALLDRKQTP